MSEKGMLGFISKGGELDKPYITVNDYDAETTDAKQKRVMLADIDWANMDFEQYVRYLNSCASMASLNRFVQAACNADYVPRKDKGGDWLLRLCYTHAAALLNDMPASILLAMELATMQARGKAH